MLLAPMMRVAFVLHPMAFQREAALYVDALLLGLMAATCAVRAHNGSDRVMLSDGCAFTPFKPLRA
jgi:hypothetical protein